MLAGSVLGKDGSPEYDCFRPACCSGGAYFIRGPRRIGYSSGSYRRIHCQPPLAAYISGKIVENPKERAWSICPGKYYRRCCNCLFNGCFMAGIYPGPGPKDGLCRRCPYFSAWGCRQGFCRLLLPGLLAVSILICISSLPVGQNVTLCVFSELKLSLPPAGLHF